MGRYLRMVFVNIMYNIKSQTTYKRAFILRAASQFTSYTVEFGLMWIMVNSFGNMNGWNKYEVMLLYAMSLASYAIAGAFFFSVSQSIRRDVHNGAFDDVLVKPLNLLPYLISSKFNFGYISHLTLSVIMTAVCFINLKIELTVFKLLYFIIAIICGALIYSALFIFTSVPAFYTTKLDSIGGIVFFFRNMSYYPLSIFSTTLQMLLTFIVPYGMMNFFPVQVVINKSDYLMFGPYISYIAPFFAIGLFVLAILFFNSGVKRYKSTGS